MHPPFTYETIQKSGQHEIARSCMDPILVAMIADSYMYYCKAFSLLDHDCSKLKHCGLTFNISLSWQGMLLFGARKIKR